MFSDTEKDDDSNCAPTDDVVRGNLDDSVMREAKSDQMFYGHKPATIVVEEGDAYVNKEVNCHSILSKT